MTRAERDAYVGDSFVMNCLILFYGAPLVLIKYEPPLWLKLCIIGCWLVWIDLIVFQKLWDPLAPDMSRVPESEKH